MEAKEIAFIIQSAIWDWNEKHGPGPSLRLDPCPICGGSGELKISEKDENDISLPDYQKPVTFYSRVICKQCGHKRKLIRIPADTAAFAIDSLSQAVKEWNSYKGVDENAD